MRIQALSAAVANQIAAGEVIENPASVVKELLENAFDAGATAIAIEIGFGGLNQIKISDNGAGIMAEDLPLAIAPHATSKLVQLSDLSTLTSMGFRGEALASIASISRIAISSKPAEQAHAMMLVMDGEVVNVTPCARSQGTTIDVRDLFYNAPVRRRFLKSERSEYLAIEHVVKRFALSAPEISLTLKHNAKLMLELPAATHEHSLRTRIQRLLGKAFMDNAIDVDVVRAGMHLKGWLSSPAYQRSQNDKQWIYLNQRMVKDKLIQHAFKQAYEHQLYPGRFPACLLYLTMPTAEVDVNVHPTKHEVRFQQPRLVHDFIASQVAEALMNVSATDAPAFHHDEPLATPETFSPTVLATSFAERQPVSQRDTLTASGLAHVPREGANNAPYVATRLQETYIPQPQVVNLKSSSQHTPSWMLLNQQFGLFNWKGQFYVFDIQQAQQQQCLWSIQQHTLPLPSRPLLVPLSIECNLESIERLKASLDTCRNYGIHMEVSDTRVMVRSIPVSMPQLAIQPLLGYLLDHSVLEVDMPLLLARFQLTDSAQWNVYEKDALAGYLIQQLDQHATLDSWCICLDVQRCQELLRG